LINFSRASSRTIRRAGDGLLVTLGNDVFATDHDANGDPLGLPIEGVRTCSGLHSRDLTNAVWTKTSVTSAKDATGLDGVANSASTLTATGANGTALQTVTIASGAYTFSVDVKRKTGSGTVEITDNGGANYTNIAASINSTTFTRVHITRTQANPVYGFRIVTSGDEIEVDFGQLEDGAFASSRVETTTIPVTRAADSAVITDLSWLDENQGTFLIDGVLIDYTPSTTDRIMALQNVSGSQTQDYYWVSGTPVNVNFFDGVSHVLSTGAFTPGTAFRFAAAYAIDDIVAVRDGGTPVASSDTGGVLPSGFSKLVIGNSGNGSRSMFGTIERIRYWPRRLPNSDLIFLTR
jgi:hypothetical protein